MQCYGTKIVSYAYDAWGNLSRTYHNNGGNKPGDLFDTMDEAARDFAEYINETSIEVDREYASYIYTKTVWEAKT